MEWRAGGACNSTHPAKLWPHKNQKLVQRKFDFPLIKNRQLNSGFEKIDI